MNLSDTTSEEIWVAVKTNNMRKLFWCIYIPPNGPAKYYDIHCKAIENAIQNFHTHSPCIAGDDNLPKTKWSNDYMGVLPAGYSSVA